MFARSGARAFSRSLRNASSTSRFTGRQGVASVRQSSSSHGSHSKSSDIPWAIASAVVFGLPTIYLFGPGRSKGDALHGHSAADVPSKPPGTGHDEPVKDDGDNEADAKDVEGSEDKATPDTPKDAKPAEEESDKDDAEPAAPAPEEEKPSSESDGKSSSEGDDSSDSGEKENDGVEKGEEKGKKDEDSAKGDEGEEEKGDSEENKEKKKD